ncbi:MAG: hypothetical protein ACQ9ET_00250 [Nitrosomonadaceae bacterium]
MEVAQLGIRLLTLSEVDHSAIVLISHGQVYVCEATFDNGIVISTWDEWETRRKGCTIWVTRSMVGFDESFARNYMIEKEGTPYDVPAIGWHLLKLRLGFWFGPRMSAKGHLKLYCTEYIARALQLKKSYMITPAQLYKHPDFEEVATFKL